MMISTPLVTDGGLIVYPTDRSLWRNATPVGNRLAGEFSGDLYEDDGVTKAFDWDEYTPTKRDFGKVITTLAFTNRFLPGEAVAIEMAAAGNTTEAAAIRVAQSKINKATYIQLDRADVVADVQSMEAAGLLAAGRAAVITGAPVRSLELPGDLRVTFGLPVIPTQAELAAGGWTSPDDAVA